MMGTRKPRLDLKGHIKTGLSLKLTRQILQEVYVEVFNAFPQKDVGKVTRGLDRSLNAIDEARHVLEELMFDDCDLTNLSEKPTRVYYGGDVPMTCFEETLKAEEKRFLTD